MLNDIRVGPPLVILFKNSRQRAVLQVSGVEDLNKEMALDFGTRRSRRKRCEAQPQLYPTRTEHHGGQRVGLRIAHQVNQEVIPKLWLGSAGGVSIAVLWYCQQSRCVCSRQGSKKSKLDQAGWKATTTG